MHFSEWFIRRPVGTSLLAIAITLAGAICYFLLPVSPLPQVEYPTVSVGAGLPGASPETMASAVATPLERQFGLIAGITEMTSSSAYRSPGSCWTWGRSNYWNFNTVLAPNGPSCAAGGAATGILTARSWHFGGINVATADGAVRFISENIDAGNRSGTEQQSITGGVGPYGVWGQLGCRGDKQTVSLGDL